MKRFPLNVSTRILALVLSVLLASGIPVGLLAEKKAEKEQSGPTAKLKISDVHLSAPSFDPNKDQVEIKFSLSGAAVVRVKVFDPDFEWVRTLLDGPKESGEHRVAWDGKDAEGSVVPNEAYFFTIEATDAEDHVAIYDPTSFSGGEVYNVDRADFHHAADQVTYDLPHTARVLIRLGLYNGPLLRTLVNWQPRRAGSQTEPWDGRDESGGVAVRNDSRFVALITYFTLPENSILTHGNAKIGYDEYKARLKIKRPRKEDRGRTIISNRPLTPHFPQPRTTYRNPQIQVMFPEVKNLTNDRLPLIDGTATVRVDMEEREKSTIKDHKTELYLFLDNKFVMEEGQAHIPYDFHWNFSSLDEGEHILTINLVTDNDQIGAFSQKIKVQK